MKITFILMAIMLVACSPGRRTVDDHFISEAEIDNIESFALSDENEEGKEIPDTYSVRFTGTFSDIGDNEPVKDFSKNNENIDEDPDVDFLDSNNSESMMAMFGDSDEEKRVFYVKSPKAYVYKYEDRKKKAVKILKKGQRIRAGLENGQAKIGSKYYMSLSDLSLTPLRLPRNVRASQK